MISRRNIRLNVMQTLYTMVSLGKDSKLPEPQKLLQQQSDQTRSLYIYLIYFLTEVTRYAETYSNRRAAKIFIGQALIRLRDYDSRILGYCKARTVT